MYISFLLKSSIVSSLPKVTSFRAIQINCRLMFVMCKEVKVMKVFTKEFNRIDHTRLIKFFVINFLMCTFFSIPLDGTGSIDTWLK